MEDDFIVLGDEDDEDLEESLTSSRCTYTRNPRSKRQFRLSATFPGESSTASPPTLRIVW